MFFFYLIFFGGDFESKMDEEYAKLIRRLNPPRYLLILWVNFLFSMDFVFGCLVYIRNGLFLLEDDFREKFTLFASYSFFISLFLQFLSLFCWFEEK